MNRTEKAIKIIRFLEKYKIKNATINKDFTVDVDGDVNLWSKGLTKIPIQFGRVIGNFYCNNNQLTSLKGCPEEIYGDFDCGFNQLINLEYAPVYVGGYFGCAMNQLETLVGCPKYVGGNFYSRHNNLTSLQGYPEYVKGDFICEHNPQLKSLKGIGKVLGFIYSDFYEGKLEDYKGK